MKYEASKEVMQKLNKISKAAQETISHIKADLYSREYKALKKDAMATNPIKEGMAVITKAGIHIFITTVKYAVQVEDTYVDVSFYGVTPEGKFAHVWLTDICTIILNPKK